MGDPVEDRHIRVDPFRQDLLGGHSGGVYRGVGHAFLQEAVIQGLHDRARIAAEGFAVIGTAREIRIGVRPVDHAIFEFNLALGQKVVDEFIHRDLHAQIAQEHDRADALTALGIISRFIDSLYL